jgi:hypothetical protein
LEISSFRISRRLSSAILPFAFTTVALYASIHDDLTQAEVARQEYCRRRTLLVSVPRAPRAQGLA